MRQLTVNDLEHLALGSAVLGSGGGGDPTYDILMTRYAMQQYGPVTLIDAAELDNEALVVPIGFMGAPLVCVEKLPSGREFDALVACMQRTGKKPAALMPAEIGGANAFAPLMVAGKLGLPVVDGDTLGRAFPQLQMSSCNLMKVPPAPAYLADSLGNTLMLEASDAETLEKIARNVTVAMGSSSAIAMYLMKKAQLKNSIIHGSISKAIEIGKRMSEARVNGENPIDALVEYAEGMILGEGTLIDVNQSIRDGFLEGTATLLDEKGKIEVLYQNEYLLARRANEVLATTPDILIFLESESGTPITSETLRYGLRCTLVALPAPKLWQSPEGLKLVGPRFFGYEVDYISIEKRRIK